MNGASEYRIYRKKFGESNFTRIAVIKENNVYLDDEAENGTRYCYYVVPQVSGVKAMTNIAAMMYLEAPKIEKLWNN